MSNKCLILLHTFQTTSLMNILFVQDLCEQIKCPLIPNQVYQYHSTIFVKQEYPKLTLDAKVQVHGDKKEIACALIPVQIVDPAKAPSS
jgi:hypothetical protein